MKEILINIESKEVRVAKLHNKKLHDLTIERKKTRLLTGSVYRGKVTNILKNIQSAFIDIGEGENGFIHISDIIENTQKFQEMFDMDFDLKKGGKKELNTPEDISKILKNDQTVLVQVVKEPIGSKGARLTSNLSIPGRYLVLLPNSNHRGVSRKITDLRARDKLKKLIKAFDMPSDMGLICRTAAVSATQDSLIEEAHELLRIWQKIIENFQKSKGFSCLYQESDYIKKSIMTALDKNYDRILIDDYPTYLTASKMLTKYIADEPLKIEFYRDSTPMYERFAIETAIDKALRTKIWLQSGGYLFFDRTEAMHTIDVNSGKSNQSPKENLEETIVKINMEAADEIARQLRIRSIGGLIVCDFIDMRQRKNQRRVLERLKDAIKEDSAKCTVLNMSEFGLVEMTRQRNKESLHQTLLSTCPYCKGSGLVKNAESIAIEIEREVKKYIAREHLEIEVNLHPTVHTFLKKFDLSFYEGLSKKHNATIAFIENDELHVNSYEINHLRNHESTPS